MMSQKANNILFFGCGTHKDRLMMSYILGKQESELVGKEAILQGYSLGIQRLDQTPMDPIPSMSKLVSVQDLLRINWGEDFQSYALVPNPTGKVSGVVWELNSDDLELIKYWELVDFGWYDEIEVIVKTTEAESLTVRTVCARVGQKMDKLIDTKEYRVWLQDHKLYKIVTEKSRQKYWEDIIKSAPAKNT